MVRPVRDMARRFSPHPTTVDILSVGILVGLHTLALFMLDSMAGRGGDDLLLVKYWFIYSLGLIVDLTLFFVFVLYFFFLLSWFSSDLLNPLVQLLTTIAVPILEPLRRVIPPIGGVIDISPIIAIFALYLVHDLLRVFLSYLA